MNAASLTTAAWLQAIAGLLSVAAMVWLAWITRGYARDTHSTVREMQAAREASLSPNLVASLVRPRSGDSGAPMPCLVNAGSGPALEVVVRFHYLPGGPEWTLRHPLIGAGDFIVTEPDDQKWRNRNLAKFQPGTRLEFEGTCRTSFGSEQIIRGGFDLASTLANVSRTEQQKGPRT